ncbi:hypothetical protein Ancab_017502 [Ancistrocladus abbreviatus]
MGTLAHCSLIFSMLLACGCSCLLNNSTMSATVRGLEGHSDPEAELPPLLTSPDDEDLTPMPDVELPPFQPLPTLPDPTLPDDLPKLPEFPKPDIPKLAELPPMPEQLKPLTPSLPKRALKP